MQWSIDDPKQFFLLDEIAWAGSGYGDSIKPIASWIKQKSCLHFLKPWNWNGPGKNGDASQPHVGGAFLYEALGHSIFLILARLCRRMFELPQCLQQLASIPYKRLRISTPVRSFKTGFMISPLIRIRISLSVNFPWFLLLNTNWCCNEPI